MSAVDHPAEPPAARAAGIVRRLRDRMRARTTPRITIDCRCGVSELVPYGEQWRCDCGRRWDTREIPAEDYGRVLAVARRYRYLGYAFAAAVAGWSLFLILTAPGFLLFSVPALLLSWFTLVRPLVHARFRRAISHLPRWELRPQR